MGQNKGLDTGDIDIFYFVRWLLDDEFLERKLGSKGLVFSIFSEWQYQTEIGLPQQSTHIVEEINKFLTDIKC